MQLKEDGMWGEGGEHGSEDGSYGKGKTRVRKLDLNQDPGRRPEVSIWVDSRSCVCCELQCHRKYYAIKNIINFFTYETNTSLHNHMDDSLSRRREPGKHCGKTLRWCQFRLRRCYIDATQPATQFNIPI